MWGIDNLRKNGKYHLVDKQKYIEEMRDVIQDEAADKLVQNIMDDLKKTEDETRRILEII